MQSPPDNPFRALNELANEDGLRQVVERARALAGLDQKLRQSLPPALAEHCCLANVHADRLVFLVDSPVWKTSLRLHAQTLMDAAAELGFSNRSLTLKVATMRPLPRESTSRSPSLRS